MKRIGLALGGGGIRSMAHVGVLRELTQMGFPIHHLAGTSAGAIVGAFYAAGIPIDQMERVARNLNWYTLFEPALLLRRMIPGTRLMRFLQRQLGAERTFQQLKTPLSITAVDLSHGRRVVFDQGPLLPAIRASLALPGAILPVEQGDGTVLVDGGVLSAVPTEVLRDAGCDVVIAVDVRGEAPGSFRPAAGLRGKDLFLRVGEVMSIYITDLALECADLVIRPDVEGIGSFDVKRVHTCIDAGAKAVREASESLWRLTEDDAPAADEVRTAAPGVTPEASAAYPS